MDEKEESNRLLGDTNDLVRKYRYHNGWRLVLLASLLLNIVLSCVVVTFVVCQYSTPASSYEKGFQTDLGKSFEFFYDASLTLPITCQSYFQILHARAVTDSF